MANEAPSPFRLLLFGALCLGAFVVKSSLAIEVATEECCRVFSEGLSHACFQVVKARELISAV